jgi:hypothetical protein
LVVEDADGNVITAGTPPYHFVQKRAPDGTLLFRRLIAGASDIVGLTVDQDLNITFGGTFREVVTIGDEQTHAPPGGALDSWTAQIDAKGRLRWLLGHSDSEYPRIGLRSLASDAHGNILLGATTYEMERGRTRIYVQKLRANGDSLWRRTFAAKSPEAQGLAVGADGAIWVGGGFHEHFGWKGELESYPDATPYGLLMKLRP